MQKIEHFNTVEKVYKEKESKIIENLTTGCTSTTVTGCNCPAEQKITKCSGIASTPVFGACITGSVSEWTCPND